MELMTSIPSAEHIPGIQSTNFTWITEPFLADLEKAATSIKQNRPSENYVEVMLALAGCTRNKGKEREQREVF